MPAGCMGGQPSGTVQAQRGPASLSSPRRAPMATLDAFAFLIGDECPEDDGGASDEGSDAAPGELAGMVGEQGAYGHEQEAKYHDGEKDEQTGDPFLTPRKHDKTGASSTSQTEARPASSSADSDPAKKVCSICACSALQLTVIEARAGEPHRQWGAKNLWGPFCGWCKKMLRIRFAWMKNPAVLKHIEDPSNLRHMALCSLAYVSLREEGRIQMTAGMVDQRLEALMKFGKAAEEASSTMHTQIVVIDDFGEQSVNPVVVGAELVQVVVGGQRRLGFRTMAARPNGCIALPPQVVSRGGLVTDCPEDLERLASFAAAAAKASDERAGDTVDTPASGKKRKVELDLGEIAAIPTLADGRRLGGICQYV